MSNPEDIPQDVWNTGAKMAGEYFAWLNAGNSRGNLSERAVAAMADTIARAILAAKAEEREVIAQMADARADLFDGHAMRCVNELDIVEARGAESAIKQFAAHLRGEG